LKPAWFVDQAFIRALDEFWIRPESLVLPIARYLTAKWPRALTGTVAPNEPQLFEVVRDPVLLTLLQRTPALTPGLEILLARTRYGALRRLMANGDIDVLVPTLTALAIRGWHSGYALTLPFEPRHEADLAQEALMVAELGRQLAQGDREGRDLVAAVTVYAAYAPPEPEHLQKALATEDPAVRHIEQHVTAPRIRQREIAQAQEVARDDVEHRSTGRPLVCERRAPSPDPSVWGSARPARLHLGTLLLSGSLVRDHFRLRWKEQVGGSSRRPVCAPGGARRRAVLPGPEARPHDPP
jgi:hypothetical protein